MHVYTQRGGKKPRKYGPWLPEASKATENILSCAMYHGKQANEVIQFVCRIMHNIQPLKILFTRAFRKKSTLFP